MRRVAAVVLFLAAAKLTAQTCAPSPTRLCLSAGRFGAQVSWRDAQGNTGTGTGVSLSADTGYFWFFNAANVELVVKVLDARALNGHFWVFFGALSNVQYTLTVTDTASGQVKTYTNPLGTFGSVGDTQAFSAAGIASSAFETTMKTAESTTSSSAMALQESLLRDHPTVADAGTCVATPTSLCLSGGRFRTDVSWKDFAGNTGVGTAVALTGDTGYFWFFNDANVELVAKVLDARTLNGRFWVFYGALSNVEYEMKVTDTLTGVVNTYSNPSGRFASTGDTEAFKTGYSVAAQLDDSRAASAVIPVSGGTLSTVGADGTVFTLILPDGALLSEEEITMTPVTAIDRLPLSGGLAAAVQLGPEGLQLFQAATLVIQTPTPVAVDSEITFAWRGSGDEFFLYPPDPLGTPEVTLDVFNLSGYGVGRGTSADQASQQGRPPESVDDQLEQDLQGPAADERKTVRNGGTLGTERGSATVRPSAKTPAQVLATQYLTHYFLAVIGPLKPTTCESEWIKFAHELRKFAQKVVRLTGSDQTLTNAVLVYFNDLYLLEVSCFDKAYDRCKSNLDPSQGEYMARLYFAILNNAPAIHVDRSKIPSCLTFELRFDSTIDEPPIPNLAGATVIIRHKSSAVVKGLKFSFGGNEGNVSAPLTYAPTFTFLPGDSECAYAQDSTNSTFQLAQADLQLNVFPDVAGGSLPIKVTYDPGEPDLTMNLNCPGNQIHITTARWREIYGLHHYSEYRNSNFVAQGWQKTGGDPYAIRKYRTPTVAGVESTDIVLKHTPQ